MPRVVSMVPSWTETLLCADVEVVGRTRFCVHPAELVASIPKVGGTKDWKVEKIKAVHPDLLILDREENPRWMAEDKELPFWASHIQGVESLPGALADLATRLESMNGPAPKLLELQERWQEVVKAPPACTALSQLPGVLEWGRRPRGPITTVVYVIWREPWMAVGPRTFIGSVLKKLGLHVHPSEEAYPQVDLTNLPDGTLLLFSSEPYPFLRKRQGLQDLGHPYAFVDGECFSWFGVRSLRFLEEALSL